MHLQIKSLLNLIFLCCAKDMLWFYALEFRMFISGDYQSSFKYFGLQIPYKEMQHDTRGVGSVAFLVYLMYTET